MQVLMAEIKISEVLLVPVRRLQERLGVCASSSLSRLPTALGPPAQPGVVGGVSTESLHLASHSLLLPPSSLLETPAHPVLLRKVQGSPSVLRSVC